MYKREREREIHTHTHTHTLCIYTYTHAPRGLGKDHVCLPLDIAVEPLEQVLEEQGHETTSQLQALISVVILVVQQFGVEYCLQHPAHDVRDVDHL